LAAVIVISALFSSGIFSAGLHAETMLADSAKPLPGVLLLLLEDSDLYSIIISPKAILFTESGQSSHLNATVYNKQGNMVDLDLTWSSSNPQVVSVNKNGLISSIAPVGSATITASSGNSVSNSVTVIVAEPAVDSVLISDNQVVGEVVPEDPDAPLGVGVRNIVRLTGIMPPQPGTILLGTGEQPVGGKVVSAVQDGDVVEVILETVPIDEIFDKLIITEDIDISHEVPIIAKVFADNYDVTWQPDGTLNFTLRNATPALSEETPRPLAATGIPMGSQVLNPNANHGPFECEAGFATPFVLDGFPPSLSVTNGLLWNFNYDSTQGGLQSLYLLGNITGTLKVKNTFTAALDGKVSCKTKLGEIPIPLAETGALSAFALYVPLGVGFDVEGKITLLQLGYEIKTEARANVYIGVVCPGGENCTMINNLNPDVKFEPKWITPDMSGTTLGVLSQMRLEPSLSGYLFSGLELGFSPVSYIPGRAKFLKVQAGVKLGGNFATVEGQMADKTYKSDYLLTNDSSIGTGVEFDAFGGLLHINLVPSESKYTDPIAESPKALSATAVVNEFDAGDLINFTVSLDPQHINYPIIVYNVGRVSIYRQTEDDNGGVGPAELLTEVIPANGATEIQLPWIADEDGSIGADYFAFVETKALPFPYFGELEVTNINSGSSCEHQGFPGPETVMWGGHEWQRCNLDAFVTWDEAMTYCEDLILGGYSDWRVPTKDEAKSLVVCSNGHVTPLADWNYAQTDEWNYLNATCCLDYDPEQSLCLPPFADPPVIDSIFELWGDHAWSSTFYDDTDSVYIVEFRSIYGNTIIVPTLPQTHFPVRCVR